MLGNVYHNHLTDSYYKIFGINSKRRSDGLKDITYVLTDFDTGDILKIKKDIFPPKEWELVVDYDPWEEGID